MSVMDEYIKNNKDQAGQQFFIDVWEEGPIKDVCVRIWVSTVKEDAEKEVDSEQADLLEKIAILKKGYEERKAQEVVAPQPVVEKVEEETEVVEDVQADEPVVETEEPSLDETEVAGQPVDDFSRISNGGAIYITVDGGTQHEQDMNAYRKTVDQELVRLINEVRTTNSLSELQLDETAMIYAGEKALDIMGTGQLSLTNSDGKTPIDYLKSASPNLVKGYHAVGQCIRLDDPKLTAKNLFDQFIAIPGMKDKVLDGKITHIAVSVAFEDRAIFVSELLTGY